MTRKFTYTDVSDWKVVNSTGKTLRLAGGKDKKGNTIWIERFDGYRTASQAARTLNGTAVRV